MRPPLAIVSDRAPVEQLALVLADSAVIDESYRPPSEAAGQSRDGGDAVALQLRPIQHLLNQSDITELVINRPGYVCVEAGTQWHELHVPEMTLNHCLSLATAVATFTGQGISEKCPSLSATLATGERMQFVIPPAVEQGTISVTIRKPSKKIFALEDFEAQGLFEDVELICDTPEDVHAKGAPPLDPDEQALLKLLWNGCTVDFLRQAVRRRRTMVVSGATGSGKTTFMKGVMQECPISERLITIEDAREIFLPRHPNKVHLLYSKGDQGVARVTAAQLLVACLRMRPDRILLAEIREGEAYFFLRTAASGHPGSITSMHAGTVAEAWEQMALMIRQSEAGAGLEHAEVHRLLRLLVDVIVQYAKDPHSACTHHRSNRRVSQIYYRPLRKRREVLS
jgi:type IV secretion system protein VirB11